MTYDVGAERNGNLTYIGCNATKIICTSYGGIRSLWILKEGEGLIRASPLPQRNSEVHFGAGSAYLGGSGAYRTISGP